MALEFLKTKVDLLGGSDLEKKVKEATSNENWGAPSSLLSEISKATYTYEGFREIMPLVWKRLGETGKNWRICFKTMSLLDHLIRNGSERVVENAQDNIYAIRSLKEFHYIDENRVDRGAGVREKAKQLVDLLQDRDRLREARDAAKKMAGKYVGVSSDGMRSRSSRSHEDSGPKDRGYDRDPRDQPGWDRPDSRDSPYRSREHQHAGSAATTHGSRQVHDGRLQDAYKSNGSSGAPTAEEEAAKAAKKKKKKAAAKTQVHSDDEEEREAAPPRELTPPPADASDGEGGDSEKKKKKKSSKTHHKGDDHHAHKEHHHHGTKSGSSHKVVPKLSGPDDDFESAFTGSDFVSAPSGPKQDRRPAAAAPAAAPLFDAGFDDFDPRGNGFQAASNDFGFSAFEGGSGSGGGRQPQAAFDVFDTPNPTIGGFDDFHVQSQQSTSKSAAPAPAAASAAASSSSASKPAAAKKDDVWDTSLVDLGNLNLGSSANKPAAHTAPKTVSSGPLPDLGPRRSGGGGLDGFVDLGGAGPAAGAAPGYGAGGPGYGMPPMGYPAPQPGYGAPPYGGGYPQGGGQPGYAPPHPGYGAPYGGYPAGGAMPGYPPHPQQGAPQGWNPQPGYPSPF